MDQALLRPDDDVCPAHDPMLSAENAGLISDDEPGITREKDGAGFLSSLVHTARSGLMARVAAP